MKPEDEVSTVVIGHVDHGKSTLVGRLLYETGELGDGRLEQLKQEAESRDSVQSKFAFAMDQFEEEREKLVTIDTRSRHINLGGTEMHFADAPGHRKWIRNVIMGSMFADAAMLVVRADRGPEAQTKEHTWISKRLFGIEQMVVAVEMMDLVDYSEERFEEVREQVEELMETVEHTPEQVQFVPTAGFQGQNISEAPAKMPWWNGPTLIDALEEFEHDTPYPDKPPRFMCLESFRDPGRDAVLASGLMLQGTIDRDDRVEFLPSNKVVDIDAIEDMGEEKEVARPEDRVTLVIDDSDSDTDDIFVEDIQRGYFAVMENDDLSQVDKFRSELYLCKSDLEEGDEISVWVYGNAVNAEVAVIEGVEDAASQEPSGPGSMEMGEVASVTLELDSPVIIQPIEETRRTSMFIALEEELAIGYGNATEVIR